MFRSSLTAASRSTSLCFRSRCLSQHTHVSSPREAWLYLDSVFPIRLGAWDLRYYFGVFRKPILVEEIGQILSQVHVHDFSPVSLEPQAKDGGVFVHFRFSAEDGVSALDEIEDTVRKHFRDKGGVPSSAGLRRGSVWLVKGHPWLEDMNRFVAPVVRVVFDGADPSEESLYRVFRPYGRIHDISPPFQVPGTSYRASTITFTNFHAATIARHVNHGLDLGSTRLRTSFQPTVQAHMFRDWFTKHPRISVPVIVFLLGTITYTIFDPIRTIMVEAKLLEWLDYRQFKLYQWLRRNTIDRLSAPTHETEEDMEAAWKERADARLALQNYLSDMPTTIAFLHGPQGSGKTRMLNSLLRSEDRSVLVIDCVELAHARSDMYLVDALARQTGYWPIFTFLNSMNGLIDLASAGIIGQKAGLSSTLPEQVKQVLDTVGTALQKIAKRHTATTTRTHRRDLQREAREREEAEVQERIRRGVWHDPRMGPVAGGGVLAELGTGEEPFGEMDETNRPAPDTEAKEGGIHPARTSLEADAVSALPIVVIKNFAVGGRDEIMDVFATWAATLVGNRVAHVIVVSDNRENSKRLSKALPTKPLYTVALYDADAASALQFVTQRLRDVGIDADFNPEQTGFIERLGGRASDLASLIHKVRAGQRVEEAVEDIINRGVSELRKNAFGDDAEDAKGLSWTREQAWAVVKALSRFNEVPYHEMLVDFPFKGDEAALRHMEQAELINIGTHNGRPSVIRPGKPVYHFVFEKLVNDPIFKATQDITYNSKLVESAEGTIRACEQELTTLKNIGTDDAHWWSGSSATQARARYLLEKMQSAQGKVEKLEKQIAMLKKTLAKGG
ncbi:exonuclease [Amylostereum chailletii]|nr:exonuclease [Amylostereum chailletii]